MFSLFFNSLKDNLTYHVFFSHFSDNGMHFLVDGTHVLKALENFVN